MESKLFIINGLFFQNKSMIGIGKTGETAEINQETFRTMFFGVINLNENVGALSDHYGPSIITDVFLEENNFHFYKKYEKRRDRIFYKFKKDGDIWVGFYSGEAVGTGAVKCILIPMTEDFFLPTGLEKLLEEDPPF